MALVITDRVRETSTTAGTGSYVLAGAVIGHQAFAVIGDANTTHYCATDGTDWEVGTGTYTASGTILARTTILASSNADAAVNWAAGTRNIFGCLPATIISSLLSSGAIDTLAELNAIITDATLIDTTDSRLSDARTPTAHNQAASTITTGTFANALVAASNVTQHAGSLSITESQISDFGTYSTTGHSHAATGITSGTLAHERGGLEFDVSAVAVGDVIAGTGTGTMAIIAATGASEGDVLTIQADGTTAYEPPAGGASSPLTLTAGVAGQIPLTVVAHATQSANMTEWEDSSNVVGAHVTLSQEFHNTGGGTNSCVYGDGAGVDGNEPGCASFGVNAICYGDDSVSFGYGAVAGSNGSTSHQNNVAIGYFATAAVSSSVAIGYQADADVSAGVAIGNSAVTTGNSSVAIGSSASCGTFGGAIGQGVSSTGSGVTIGKGATGAFALGYNADSSAHSSAIAIGTSALAGTTYAIAVGKSANSSFTGSIALGYNTDTTANNQFVVGSHDTTSARITDVFIGRGVVSALAEKTTHHATGGSGTDIAGGDYGIAGGKGTGSAAGGEITFEVSTPGSTGTTLQTLAEKLRIGYDGTTLVAQSNTPGTPASGEMVQYMKGSKLIYAYDDGGTVRYTGVTWVHTTSAP